MNKPILLCVDDEPMVLSSLSEQLRRVFGQILRIEIAESGEAAIEILHSIADSGDELRVLLCDQLMPGVKGDEVIVYVHSLMPRVRSILLTGQSDLRAISHAINLGGLYRYLAKPWDTEDLNMTIREALHSYEQEAQIAQQFSQLELVNAQLVELNTTLEQKVHERTRQLDVEKERSDELLRNILPDVVAERLKNGETRIADSYTDVSVLFADIVDFSSLSQNSSADELVQTLDQIFTGFDFLADTYGMEKIKTIGDSYMVVSGLPQPREDHALSAAHMAVDMMQHICQYKAPHNSHPIQIRIGIHSGDVIAGVIGKKKFAYDLWGDAVNTAARMESHSESGRIHVSSDFVEALQRQQQTHHNIDRHPRIGKSFDLMERGDIVIKGKGIMRTYFLS